MRLRGSVIVARYNDNLKSSSYLDILLLDNSLWPTHTISVKLRQIWWLVCWVPSFLKTVNTVLKWQRLLRHQGNWILNQNFLFLSIILYHWHLIINLSNFQNGKKKKTNKINITYVLTHATSIYNFIIISVFQY